MRYRWETSEHHLSTRPDIPIFIRLPVPLGDRGICLADAVLTQDPFLYFLVVLAGGDCHQGCMPARCTVASWL